MLAYVKGILAEKEAGYIVIDVGGLGYKILMTSTDILKLGEIDTEIKVHTYYKVREDDISIYGFISKEELRMFEILISASGIGTKSALSILDNIEPSDFALAIITNDVSKIVKLPGIGAKTAQRMILELKDKINTEEEINKANELNSKSKTKKQNQNDDEAISALQILGYNRKDIEKVMDNMDTTDMKIEDIIKSALKLLSK